MDQYINIIRFQINLKTLFPYNSSLILCVSGGQDSNFLYFIIFMLGYQYRLTFFLSHCNHSWQKDAVLNQHNLTRLYYLNKHSVSFFMPFNKVNTEALATLWRYTSFQRLCLFLGVNFLLNGHTNTDQIESFLFYLSRGSKINFVTQFQNTTLPNYNKLNFFTIKKLTLKKIAFSKQRISQYSQFNFIIITKPVQLLNRYEIFKLVSFLKFPVWTDQTNFSMRYSRNRIRYQLLPLIRFYFNAKMDVSIHRFLNGLLEEILFIDSLTSKLADSNIIVNRKVYFTYTFAFFFSCPYIFQKRLLMEGFNQIQVQDINYKYLEFILKFLYTNFYTPQQFGKKVTLILGNNLKIISYQQSFHFYKV